MEKLVLNSWFECGSQKNGSGIYGSGQVNERRDRVAGPVRIGKDWNDSKPAPPGPPPTFEQICQAATVKPPQLTYGIQKVAEMANSSHLGGMTAEFKRKALLMALDAASTDVGGSAERRGGAAAGAQGIRRSVSGEGESVRSHADGRNPAGTGRTGQRDRPVPGAHSGESGRSGALSPGVSRVAEE